VIGAIADDFTGATDVAVAFRRRGLRTRLIFGVPEGGAVDADGSGDGGPVALVIALKTRTTPAEYAVQQSVAAARWLQGAGARQLYFKYCSTFDSTPAGNIGPVLDALSELTDARRVLMTPSAPTHRRTQYQGYLFVDGVLLSESHMAHHPLTPMTDSSLPRLLSAQTRTSVGLVRHEIVRLGFERIRAEARLIAPSERTYLLVDAIDDGDLEAIGRAAASDPLVAGAAGLATGLAAAADGSVSGVAAMDADTDRDLLSARAAILTGSCSRATLAQISVLLERGHPAHRLDPTVDANSAGLAAAALAWYDALPNGPTARAPLIYSSAEPAELSRIQGLLGVEGSASILESAIGRIAAGLVERGVRRIISAGGETSAAVTSALGVHDCVIGTEAAPGVPWIFDTRRPLVLLLKSGNFGGPTLLADAGAPEGTSGG
jgi:uncharacterized protein YgbK (DUF1537 family)